MNNNVNGKKTTLKKNNNCKQNVAVKKVESKNNNTLVGELFNSTGFIAFIDAVKEIVLKLIDVKCGPES